MTTHPTVPASQGLAPTLPPFSALVIEDDTISAQLLELALAKRCGAIVRSVDSAETALPLIRSIDWDVIFVDIGLPQLNGLDLLALSKGVRPQTPHIVVTSRAGDDELLAAARAGADDYLVKPVRTVALVRSVVQVLGDRLGQPPALNEIAA